MIVEKKLYKVIYVLMFGIFKKWIKRLYIKENI